MNVFKKACLSGLLLTLAPMAANASAMLSGFGGDEGYGELAMAKNDDASTSADLPFSVNFFGNTYDSMFINNNGNLSFNSAVSAFVPTAFPVAAQPMIAPFWGDVDTRCNDCGNVYVGAPSEGVVAVTWSDVGFYSNHAEQTNSFQAVLIDRSAETGSVGDFDVEFRYDNLSWTQTDTSEVAQAGYDAGDGMNYFALPGSRTESVTDLQNNSNVGEAGVWRFSVRDGALPGETPENPLMPVVTDGGWQFDFNVDENELVFIDPDVAVGYDYILDTVNSGVESFASVLLPMGFDDDLFELWVMESGVWAFIDTLVAGVEYSFADDVTAFRIMGIDVEGMVDPLDQTAFVTGLTFNGTGVVSMTQSAVTEFVPDPVGVNEPSALILLLLALMLLVLSNKQRVTNRFNA